MTQVKCWSVSLGREGEVDCGTRGQKKKKNKKDNFGKSLDMVDNFDTKYAVVSECMKNI